MNSRSRIMKKIGAGARTSRKPAPWLNHLVRLKVVGHRWPPVIQKQRLSVRTPKRRQRACPEVSNSSVAHASRTINNVGHIEQMATTINTALRPLKFAVAAFGSLAWFVASIVIAWSARSYQVSGQPMPNGKGGLMTFRDGYLIALVLFLLSIAWSLGVRRIWRSR
jgi:hypothetical protein